MTNRGAVLMPLRKKSKVSQKVGNKKAVYFLIEVHGFLGSYLGAIK